MGEGEEDYLVADVVPSRVTLEELRPKLGIHTNYYHAWGGETEGGTNT